MATTVTQFQGDVNATENTSANDLAVKAAQEQFVASQTELLSKIGCTWKREESDRMEGWYNLSRLVAEYVGNELAHYGASKKSYAAAVRRVEAHLTDYTDESKASVSRLLATYGLRQLMVAELADDAAAVMGGLTVSLLKHLVRMIDRDETSPNLAYVWKDAAVDKGASLVCDCSDGLTVVGCKDAVDQLLAPPAETAEDDSKASARKVAAQKATGKIEGALKSAGQNGARKDALKRAVKTEALTTEDVVTVVGASADARALVMATITPDEVMGAVKGWIASKKTAQVVALFTQLREEINKLKAERADKADKKEAVAA